MMIFGLFEKKSKVQDKSRFKISFFKEDGTFNIILQDEMGLYYQEEKFNRNEVYEILSKIENILIKNTINNKGR